MSYRSALEVRDPAGRRASRRSSSRPSCGRDSTPDRAGYRRNSARPGFFFFGLEPVGQVGAVYRHVLEIGGAIEPGVAIQGGGAGGQQRTHELVVMVFGA